MNMLSDKKSVSGLVSNIQRFSLNDGPGIRTVVFLKGCPLKCPWCHNPESRWFYPEIMLDEKKCVGCGQCTKTCTLHHFVDGQHFIDRERCKHCGLCAQICPTNALTLVGKCMTVEEIYQEAMQDYGFWGESGGITLSGGEPLAQPEFSMAILRQFHEKGIHCAIETSGYAPWEVLQRFIQQTDLFLFDIKETNSELHQAYTGVAKEQIIQNLDYLNQSNAKVRLRCPIIPGYNDREGHLLEVAKLANRFSCVERIEIEPYHPLGRSKARQLGEAYVLNDQGFPDAESVAHWLEILGSATLKPVVRS